MTIKDMQQTIDKLKDEKQDLEDWAEALLAESSDAEKEQTDAVQARQRVQTHAPPQVPSSPKATNASRSQDDAETARRLVVNGLSSQSQTRSRSDPLRPGSDPITVVCAT